MKKILIFTLVLLVISFVACKENTTNIKAIKGEIELISPQQVYDAIYKDRSIQLIDVRTPEEFKGNHLKGAQNICVTSADFKEKVKILDKNKPVYVYCNRGGQSAQAAIALKELGFTKIYDMEGGILLWEENKLELSN
jgi:rhodanese-related sulfurtransferase